MDSLCLLACIININMTSLMTVMIIFMIMVMIIIIVNDDDDDDRDDNHMIPMMIMIDKIANIKIKRLREQVTTTYT